MTDTRLSPLQIAYQTRTLDNGMRVVVHEDHTSPIVAVHMMYHVGSRHETPGRTGLAHLLEHLLFEGTANCPKGEFDRLLDQAGGTNNGSTWLDRTNYYEVVPSHAVELALWLERERIAYFLPVLDDAMLELQRGVVMNERRQTSENRPYGMADERLHELLFPDGHPYSWPTIGYMRDLAAIQLEDVQTFFQHFYTPGNAVLVLAGAITPDDGFRLAERYFGDLPAGRSPNGGSVQLLPGRRAKAADTLEDRVTLPRVYRAFPVAPYGSAEWIALDVLTYLLSDGESSRLQRRLIREQPLALEVDAYVYPTELHGVLGVVATGRSGVESAMLESEIEAVLAEIATGEIEEEEVGGAVRRARRDQLSGLAHLEERAEELAYATMVLGDPAALTETLSEYGRVGPAELQEVARRYLEADHGAVVTVIPRDKEAQAEVEVGR